MPASNAPRHTMERAFSVTPLDRSVEPTGATQATEILDIALSEDSLGLTPPKPPDNGAAQRPARAAAAT